MANISWILVAFVVLGEFALSLPVLICFIFLVHTLVSAGICVWDSMS